MPLATIAQFEVRQDEATNRIDFAKDISRLTQAWQTGAVHTVEVLHISYKAEFPHNISSSALEAYYDFKLTVHDPESSVVIKQAIGSITNLTAKLSGKVSDLRWACIFYSEDGSRICAIYFDRTGRRGVVNGACVDFGSDDLKRWAESNFSSAFR